MAEQTTNYIEIDGEGKYIEDTAAREGVSQNATAIQTINGFIPEGTAANNKLVNASQLSAARKADKITWLYLQIATQSYAENADPVIIIPAPQGKKIVAVGGMFTQPMLHWSTILQIFGAVIENNTVRVNAHTLAIIFGQQAQTYTLNYWIGVQDL